jgi:hypothetical protein
MSFHVGQKVACIDDRPSGPWTRRWLVLHCVYTVARILPPIDPEYQDHLGSTFGVDLLEIPDKPNGFGGLRFRPIIERKTDISIFTAMLKPQGVDA